MTLFHMQEFNVERYDTAQSVQFDHSLKVGMSHK